MNPNKRVLFISGVAAVIIILVIGLLGSHSRGNGSSSNGGKKLPSANPPQEVLDVVSKYIQSREDSIGVDQSTPNSWLSQVQPLTTPGWFAKLQPQPGSAGSGLGDYYSAHNFGYQIKANTKGCIWDFKIGLPTSTAGTVYCQVTDNVIDKDGNQVEQSSLPFGWTHTGTSSTTLSLVKQDGHWLVSGDLTGND